jgi:predicted phage baseplate assembly protein
MSCKHDCPKPPAFPKTIFNRPGLDRIDYRIGTYARVREHLLDRLNAQPALSAWTHRGTDDPGIALLESDAIVIDILTFYQSLYANEAYLRTAQWSQSVADLVRLGGYRLAPGVAGETTFALTVAGERAITVPIGFGLKAQIEGIDKPVDFETREMLDAVPALGTFALYRPRTVPPISAGMRVLSFQGSDIDLKADDRLLLGDATGGANARLSAAEIVVVEDSWEAFGQRYVQLKSPLRRSTPIGSLRAYKLGETFRHFGHQAPETIATVSSQGVPSQRAISFQRYTAFTTSADVDPDLAATEVALDRGYDKIAPGESIIVQGRFSATSLGTGQRFTLARRVVDAEQRSLRWGSLSGASTVLTVEQAIAVSGYAYYDVRSITIWQTQGEAFTVQAAPVHTAAASGDVLRYYGRSEDAQALVGRRLLLAHPDGTVDDCVVHVLLNSAPGGFGFHALRLSREVDYADFGYEGEVATVYGNIIDANQGKTLERTPIGSGDARARFQSFALPKAPLTYLFDATSTPAQVPALEIFVDDRRWARVDTLFSSGPDDRVYIVREDREGNSVVQFGDGKTGARLGSGRNNVVAQYRVGIAAYGELKPDTTPQATGKLDRLDKVFLPVAVDTGAPAESADNARRAAPVRLQSLGRLVSLADYETETRMLPNVVKASARWDAPDGTPTVVLTVLTASGSEADNIAIRDALTGYSRCRGPARYPFIVRKGYRQYVHLHAAVGYDLTYTIESLSAQIKRALGVAGEEAAGIDGRAGLFGIDRREFRSTVHTSEILAAIQNVPGVVWVELRAANAIALGVPPETDPLALALPAIDLVPAPVLACASQALLALHSKHLVLSFAVAAATSECGS